MSAGKIVLVVLLVLAAVAAIAGVVVEQKFDVFVGAPKIPHAELTKPATRLQVVLEVPLAKDLIKERFLKDLPVPVPDAVLASALPYEAALLAEPDPALGLLDLRLVVNDRRLGPIIQQKAAEFKIPPPLDAWFKDSKLLRKQPGLLSMQGSGAVDSVFARDVRMQWSDVKVESPLAPEGQHLVELILDNRDGGAMLVASAVAALMGFDLGEQVTPGRLEMIADVASVRLQLDPVTMDEWKARLVIECSPETDPMQAQVIGMLIDAGINQAKAQSPVPIEGKSTIKEKSVEANLTVSGVESLLKMAGINL